MVQRRQWIMLAVHVRGFFLKFAKVSHGNLWQFEKGRGPGWCIPE